MLLVLSCGMHIDVFGAEEENNMAPSEDVTVVSEQEEAVSEENESGDVEISIEYELDVDSQDVDPQLYMVALILSALQDLAPDASVTINNYFVMVENQAGCCDSVNCCCEPGQCFCCSQEVCDAGLCCEQDEFGDDAAEEAYLETVTEPQVVPVYMQALMYVNDLFLQATTFCGF
jgi:hypothetical protein